MDNTERDDNLAIPYTNPGADGDQSESSIPGPVTEQDAEPEPEPEADEADKEAEPPAPPAESPPEREAGTTAHHADQQGNAAVLAASRTHTRRSFAVAAVGAVAGYAFWRWAEHSPAQAMQPGPIRAAFENNAAISRRVFNDRALAPTYPVSRAENLRVNGVYGLKQALVPASWRLQLVGSQFGALHPRYSDDVTAWEYRYTEADAHADQGHDTKVAPKPLVANAGKLAVPPSADTAEKMAPEGMVDQEKAHQQRTARMPRGLEEAGRSASTLAPGTPGLLLVMDDITKLPRHELVTQFKCIEGWSQVVHWSGVRMADFLEAYPPAKINGAEPKYVYMETPNGDYYTGYDLAVCRHPQTLLVTEMMGQPLEQFHGAPLRLHMPTKYGYKQIKRIGLISYTNTKPDDYWTKLGYDWYAGL